MGWTFIALGLVDIALGLLFWLRPNLVRGEPSPARRMVPPLLVVSGLFAVGVGVVIALF